VPNSDPTNYTAISTDVAAFNCLAAKNSHQAGYDTVRGDPFFQMDVRVAKNIRLREGWNLQLIFQRLT